MVKLSQNEWAIFSPLHLPCVVIINVDSDEISNNLHDSMLKNPKLYSVLKWTFSWDKTTDHFSSLREHSLWDIVMFLYWINPALPNLMSIPFTESFLRSPAFFVQKGHFPIFLSIAAVSANNSLNGQLMTPLLGF